MRKWIGIAILFVLFVPLRLLAGPTYLYVAASVDVNGFQSPNSNQVTVVFGTNTDGTPQHIANLSWTASVVPAGSAAIAGYNIYRGSVSGGPYTKINGSLVTGTTYTDPFTLPSAPVMQPPTVQ